MPKIKNPEEIEPSFAQEDIPTRATAKKIFKNEKQKAEAERKDFVPLMNPKLTTEIQVKPKPTIEQIEIIEKKENPQSLEKLERKTRKRKEKLGLGKITENINSKSQKLEKLQGNSIVIITEKPQAAEKISAALSGGRARRYSDSGVSYFEFEKNSERIVVACAVGHLFSLSQDVKGSDYPIFEISWKPNFEVRKKDFTKKYYLNLKKLVKRAKEIIIATDYDIEGEVIGYNIVRFIANQKDAKRMKFSSLTKDEIDNAFSNLHPTLDWGNAIAGETRHFIDWYYGINLSRALMNAIKSTGKFKIMSIGRVQGPALKLIVEKEKEIEAFKPIPYWKIFITVKDKKDKTNQITLRHVKDIFSEKELPMFEKLKGKIAEVSTEKHQQTLTPPPPFDLTSLQTESYKFYSITPAKTLQIAQSLYLAGIISYPRTSSQKIPETINPKQILKRLSNSFPIVKIASRSKPIEGKKSDPAHPSIYPTGEIANLGGEEKKVYELIVKRFISCFCPDALIENKTITAVADNLVFKERGLEVKEQGWTQVYSPNFQEKEIKDMNGQADIIKVDIQSDETKPPKRYSPASIITQLEHLGLGTKATRSSIIETLYDRNYITDNKSIKATPLGINLINTLEKYSPIIVDEKLTRSMEKDMESIQLAKKDLDKKEKLILDKAQVALKDISKDFKEKEEKIGKELVKAQEQSWKLQNEQNEIMPCPVCKTGKLTIKFSPKNKKHFIACNAYPNCKTTFSLPPYGMIKKLSGENNACKECNFPLLMSLQKGKRPWIFCFNPNCPSRQRKEPQNQE
jgi:DNA topoisomerase-1